MGLVLNSISGSKEQSSNIGITGSLKIGLPSGGAELPAMPAGTTFFVSGSTAGDIDRAAFGGDVVISGSLHSVGTIRTSGFVGRHGDSGTSLSFGPPAGALADDQISLLADGKAFMHVEGDEQHVYLGRAGAFGWTTNKDSKVYILSGGAGASYDEADGSDVAFYVSGTHMSWGNSATEGLALFGGTVAMSSSLFVHHGARVSGQFLHNYPYDNSVDAKFMGGLSGSLTQLPDGASYLVAGANITIASQSNGQVTITGAAASGGGGAGSEGWIAPSADVISTTGSLFIGVSGGSSDPDITLGGNGAAIFNLQQAAVDFTVASDDKAKAIFVDGSTNQVLILSGGSGASLDEAIAEDVSFYVSGSKGSIGLHHRGTAVFGGDLFVSGVAVFGGDYHHQQIGSYVGGTISGSIHHTSGGLSYIRAGSNVTVTSASNGQILIAASAGSVTVGNDADNRMITSDGDGTFTAETALTYDTSAGLAVDDTVIFNDSGADKDFRVESQGKVGAILLDAATNQLALLSPAGTTHANAYTDRISGTARELPGDIALYVSGAIDGKGVTSGVNAGGVALFAGDVVISGTLYGGDSATISDTVLQNRAALVVLQGGAIGAAPGLDVSLFVSGAVGDRASTSERGTAMFGGDLAVSGTLTALRSGDGAHAAIMIDKDYTGTTDVGSLASGGTDATGLTIDYDVTGIVASGQTAHHDAIAIHYNQDAPTHVGTINATGADIRMTGGTSGVQAMKGLAINLAGADSNTGIDVTVPNGGTHFIARSPDALLDYFLISVGESGATTLSTSDAGASVGHLTLDADGKIILNALAGKEVAINEAGENVDFRVESADNTHAIFVDAAESFVGIGHDADIGNDISFFVSGSIAERGSNPGASRKDGIAAFGGDVFVSGVLYVGSEHLHETLGSYVGGTISGSIHHTSGGISFIKAGTNMTVTSASNGQITLTGGGARSVAGDTDNGLVTWVTSDNTFAVESTLTFDGTDLGVPHEIFHTGDDDTFVGFDTDQVTIQAGGKVGLHMVEGTNDYLYLGSNGDSAHKYDKVLILSGGSGADDYDPAAADDVVFFVSGAAGDGLHGALMGGNLTVSGNLKVDYDHHGSLLHIDAVSNKVIFGQKQFFTPAGGSDDSVWLFVSGNVSGPAGPGTQNCAVFGGDTKFSGSILTEQSLSVDSTSFFMGALNSYGGAVFNDMAANVDFRVETQGEDEALLIDADANKLYVNKGNTAFETIIENTNAEAINVTAAGVVFNEEGNASNNFRIESNHNENVMYIDGEHGIVSFGSQNAPGQSTMFFVSGAVNDTSSEAAHTAVFGGDLITSGALLVVNEYGGDFAGITIETKGTSTSDGATLKFSRSNISTEADDMEIALIEFTAVDSGNNSTAYAEIEVLASDVTDGDEGGKIEIKVMANGLEGTAALKKAISIGGEDAANGTVGAVVINDDQAWMDFRVESNYYSHALFVSGATGAIGIGQSQPLTALDVYDFYDYSSDPYSKFSSGSLYPGASGGRTLAFSPGADDTLASGALYFLHTDGTWNATDASAASTGATQLLGLGKGGKARQTGVTLEGYAHIPGSYIEGAAANKVGQPVYVSETANKMTFTPPSTSAAFMRIVGYCIDHEDQSYFGGDSILMYFKPGTAVTVNS